MRSEHEAALLAAIWRKRARVVVKADLLPAVSVLSFVALLGVPIGWIWALLAPPTEYLVSGSQLLTLPREDLHAFDAIGLQCFLGLAAGAVIGAVTWLLRERRGPVVMIAAVLGALLGGWLAHAIGNSFAHGFYPPPSSTHAGQIVSRAPDSGPMLSIVCWGLGTSLVYGVLAVWNGMADLGRRLS